MNEDIKLPTKETSKLPRVEDLFVNSYRFWKVQYKKLIEILFSFLVVILAFNIFGVLGRKWIWDNQGLFMVVFLVYLLLAIIFFTSIVEYLRRHLEGKTNIYYLSVGLKKLPGLVWIGVLVFFPSITLYFLAAVITSMFQSSIMTVMARVFFLFTDVYLVNYFTFSFYTYVFGDKKGVSALVQSFRLVKGYWLAVLGRQIIMWLLSVAVPLVIGFLTLLGVVGVWIDVLLSSVYLLVIYLMWIKYNFDLFESLKLIKGKNLEVSNMNNKIELESKAV